MPFTLFHLGPPVLLVALIYLVKDSKEVWKRNMLLFISLFFASVIPDLQGFLHLYFDRNIPIHGFSHTLIGSIVYSVVYSALFTLLIIFLRKKFLQVYNYLSTYITFPSDAGLVSRAFFFCFASINIFHIFPDITMHYDIQFFYPFSNFTFIEPYYDPIYGNYLTTNPWVLLEVTILFFLMGFIGVLLLIAKFSYKKITK